MSITRSGPVSTQFPSLAIVALLVVGGAGCKERGPGESQVAAAESNAPAAATVTPHESEAALVRLRPDVRASLDVQVAAARTEPMRRLVRRAALVLPRPDRRSAVAAPVTGAIEAVNKGFPALGDEVAEGQVLFRIAPQLSVERDLLTGPQALDVDLKELDLRVRLEDAGGLRESARTALAAAERELIRARALVEASIVGSRRLDDAQTTRDLAAVVLDTAKRRVAQLEAEEARPSSRVKIAEPMEVRAPISGRVDSLSARPGQVIPAGLEVLAIVDDTSPWLSVQVYAAELTSLDLSTEIAAFTGVANESTSMGSAVPLHTPSPAAAPGSMVSRLYRLNAGGDLRSPGERLFVDIPANGTLTATAIPWSAVIFDAYGGVWVYLEEHPHEFRRRGVRFLRRDGDLALVGEGLEAGALVVASGAYELFAIEFGGGQY